MRHDHASAESLRYNPSVRLRPFALLALVALSWNLASEADAQRRWQGPEDEPSDEAMAEARAIYNEGAQAAEEERWADAIGLFEQSYALSGRASALYSIGYTSRNVGRFIDARDALDQLLAQEDVDDVLRDQAIVLRHEVQGKIALLSLIGLENYGDPSIRLDGAHAEDDGERPLELELDPGEHRLRIEAAGYSEFTWTGRLAQGDHMRVDVQMEDVTESIFESVWFWVAVGAGVLITAGIVTAVVAQNAAQLQPRTEFHLDI
jgi:hypothetical protein